MTLWFLLFSAFISSIPGGSEAILAYLSTEAKRAGCCRNDVFFLLIEAYENGSY